MANFAPDESFPPVTNICHAENVGTLSLFDLTGKTALVTGGNGGIGSGMARGLAEAGADIIIIQIPGEVSTFASDLAAATGRLVDVYDCDLGKSDVIRTTVAQILERDGRQVDILCNCAGITGGFVPILSETDEHRELSTFYRILFGRHMAERGLGGKIINIASLAAERSLTRFSVYEPIKAAVGQLTNWLSTELAVYNIQVNCLYPGWTHTPLSQKTTENAEVSNKIISGVPAGRWGKPQDFKGVTVFLASSASDYITGARIWVDCGAHSM